MKKRRSFTQLILNSVMACPRSRESNLVRFYENVRFGPHCWEWTGKTDDSGYGQFSVRRGRKVSARMGAHRFSCAYFHKTNMDGLFACHKCDNPGCVNPDHLFAGTIKANVDDMIAKGRASFQKEGFVPGFAALGW